MKETDVEAIQELFMGRRIVAVEMLDPPVKISDSYYSEATGRLRLDDNRIVYVVPNQGGCSCGGGDYDLTSLERVDNIITRVDVVNEDLDDYDYAKKYSIFVLAGHELINAMSVEGDDGSGYYGTGYELIVVEP